MSFCLLRVIKQFVYGFKKKITGKKMLATVFGIRQFHPYKTRSKCLQPWPPRYSQFIPTIFGEAYE